MRILFSQCFGKVAIAFALACPLLPAHAQESAKPERALLLADNTPGMHRDNRFGIVPVAVPQPRSSDNTSVTLWDEITPPARPPMPIPVQHPGYTQHAMERSATNRIHR